MEAVCRILSIPFLNNRLANKRRKCYNKIKVSSRMIPASMEFQEGI